MNTNEMQPTINPGDYAILDQSVKNFSYGDMIAYEHTSKESWESFTSIFRIMGLPGDSIGVKDGIAVVNGQQNRHSLIEKDLKKEIVKEILPNNQPILIYHYFEGVDNEDMDMIKVPENSYFILGDTRTGVVDSRYYGPVPKDKILGKVIEIKKKDN